MFPVVVSNPRPFGAVFFRPKEIAMSAPVMSDEQEEFINVVLKGGNAIVDAVVGSGKTSAIQELCRRAPTDWNILYLTYNKLLKLDAQRRIRQANVKATNYHGFVYPYLIRIGMANIGISKSIAAFNAHFDEIRRMIPRYDLIVIDEYQDIREEMATLLDHLREANPKARVAAVGDMEQKISDATRLDVRAFVERFAAPAEHVAFTRTFRMGPDMGERLSRAWGKPVRGVNEDQSVEFMTPEEAFALAVGLQPRDFMVLGSRNGVMTRLLNDLESAKPETFNKRSVYASIRDADSSVRGSYGDDVAIFTTFDSSKGLERDVCFICDFTPSMWMFRSRMPNEDPLILRNRFLVAASRGKRRIVFVKAASKRRGVDPETADVTPKGYFERPSRLGFIPVSTFSAIDAHDVVTVYERPFSPSDCFDFKYGEDVDDAARLLDVRVASTTGAEVALDAEDGLMDLSPAIGNWQGAMFFTDYSVERQIKDWMKRPDHDELAGVAAISRLTGETWPDTLQLTALETSQRRYADQGDRSKVTDRVATQVRDRLASRLDPSDPTQVSAYMAGMARADDGSATPIEFSGLGDAIHDDGVHGPVLYELKFVSELTREHALQLGLYLVMMGLKQGILWNIRTNEMKVVRVPDRAAFMDAVVLAVTKRVYSRFEGVIPDVH